MRFDHVALASARVQPHLDFLVGELGGTFLFGNPSGVGFRNIQVRMGDPGMTIELLEPYNSTEVDFLERYVAAVGEAPHHMTFKVEDLDLAVEAAQDAGFHPIGYARYDDNGGGEAFLHPKEAHGTVVQFQCVPGAVDFASFLGTVDDETRWWTLPGTRRADPAVFRRLGFVVHDLDSAGAMFERPLDGKLVAEGDGWREYGWSNHARVRVEADDSRRPGVNYLGFEHDGPATELVVAGVRFVFAPLV